MQCYRMTFYTWHSGYNYSTFKDGLRMVYIPDTRGGTIPCLYYKNEKAPDGKLVLYFHGIWQDIGDKKIH